MMRPHQMTQRLLFLVAGVVVAGCTDQPGAPSPPPPPPPPSLSPPVTQLEVGTVTRGNLTVANQIDWYALPPGIFTVFVDTSECGCAEAELQIAHAGQPGIEVVSRVSTDVNLFAVVTGSAEHPPLIAVKQLANIGCYDLAVNNLHQSWNLRVEFSNARWDAKERDEAAGIFVRTARRLLTATDGGAMLLGASFYPECPTCDSDVFMSSARGRSITYPGLSIKLYAGYTGEPLPPEHSEEDSARIMVHELGHFLWSLPDEYDGPPGYNCPTSIMGDSTNDDFCWDGNHQATGYQSAWRAIVLQWSFDKWKATNAPQTVNYHGIENRIRDMFAWQGCPECASKTFNSLLQKGIGDANGNGTDDCRELDSDGDGHLDATDCDPTDPLIFPGVDRDGDGDPRAGCGGKDCNDSDPNVASTKAEVCNGADDDCDGDVDEDQPNHDGDALADCFDPNDDKDCLSDVADNCPFVDNCASAQAVLDNPFLRPARTCPDPCRPLYAQQQLEDFAKCVFGMHGVEPRCMIDGCAMSEFGVDLPAEVLVGAGLTVRTDTAGRPLVVIPPGFSFPGPLACRFGPSGGPVNPFDPQREARCREAERARTEYAACQADTDHDGKGDACQ